MDTNPGNGLNDALAAELRAERGAKQISMDALADRSGLARSSVLRYLNAQRVIPIDALDALAVALGVTPRELVHRAEARRDRAAANVGGASDAAVLDLASETHSRRESHTNMALAAQDDEEVPGDADDDAAAGGGSEPA